MSLSSSAGTWIQWTMHMCICVTNSYAEFLMLMASGPFSTLDSLEYSPLRELLEAVKQDRPSILVLVCI